MEDKIEVNEYVRTKNGEIHKVIEIKENRYITNFDDYFYYRYDNNMGGFKSDIVKHRKKLIDLIEVGDIVNKELVISIIDITNDKEERVGRKLITQYRSAQFTGLDIRYYIYDDDIKTILTKESYMANCYKLGGKQWD